MRFFKPFKLLHRRTKSDPTNALISDFSEFKPTASSYEGISDALPTFAASEIHPSPHPNLRILDLEAENSHLRNISVASLKELSDVKLLLQATQADLYAELHRGVRQRKEDRIEIERLREILEQYETFLQLVVNAEPYGPESLADAHINLQGGHTLDQALSERAATTAEFIAGDHILTALGPRTQDEYTSAIKLTLTSRMQLRNYKKIAKFWKNTAKEDGKNPHIITPSTSAISSINEVLPAERRKAVNDLICAKESNRRIPLSLTLF
ncbi:hypothetical protein FPV67DRAFT_1686704 [Lyophyllum atratum]|nr:hypothetical protein FPV67DRAFT_1686704 [Lyophyllum atratum]